MNEYISFGKVIKTVNGVEYDVSENYEIVEKGKVAELQKENEEWKLRNKQLNEEALYWKQAMIDLEIDKKEQANK